MIRLIFILTDIHDSAGKVFSMIATYLEFLFCLLMVAFSRVLSFTQIVSLTKQKADTLRLSFPWIFNVVVPSFMNWSWIFKYQVHLASVRPHSVYHILYTISL